MLHAHADSAWDDHGPARLDAPKIVTGLVYDLAATYSAMRACAIFLD
jgi:hypothetical protein